MTDTPMAMKNPNQASVPPARRRGMAVVQREINTVRPLMIKEFAVSLGMMLGTILLGLVIAALTNWLNNGHLM